MELSLNKKHDAREKLALKYGEDQEEEMEAELRKINKEMDKKRKDGLKILKEKLNEIINDEETIAD